MSQTVIGIFDNANEAQNAVQQLVTTGFTRDNIDISTQNISNQNTTTRDDDSIGGFFNSLFGGNDEARTYSHVARQGSVVTLQTRSREEAVRAAEILDRNGAVDVDRKAAETGFTNSGGQAFGETTNRAIPIIEENLEIGKREVETGGVRLRSRIVERPVEEHLRLREEHVNIERNAVNRPATDADINTFREGTIELTEHAEVPVVNKQARVVEEVSLGKEVTERDEVVRDTVRKTEVDVENLRQDRTRDSSRDI